MVLRAIASQDVSLGRARIPLALQILVAIHAALALVIAFAMTPRWLPVVANQVPVVAEEVVV